MKGFKHIMRCLDGPHPPESVHYWRLMCCCIVLLLSCLWPAYVKADDDVTADTGQRRVVILYSHPRDFPAAVMVEDGIRQTFVHETQLSVQLFSEYLDLSRFRDQSQCLALVNLLNQRYRGKKLISLSVLIFLPPCF